MSGARIKKGATVLQGKRVILRAIERDDLKRLHELYQQVDLVLFADGHWRPSPLAAYEKNFEKQLDNHDPVHFVIEVDGRVIGDVELHNRDKRSHVSSFGIGIYDREYLGKGYGREAIALLLDWAFDDRNYERIWLTTWATNERAIRCYQALGFVQEARLRRHMFVDGAYVDELVMGLLRDEWRAGQRGGPYAQRR
jgi:RimJ/RimL family protein N-acetyltransferase